jgi:hypothetical protein
MTQTKTLTAVNVDPDGGVMCVFSDTGVYYASVEQLQDAVMQAATGSDTQLQMLLLMLWMQDNIVGRTAVLDTDNVENVVVTYA